MSCSSRSNKCTIPGCVEIAVWQLHYTAGGGVDYLCREHLDQKFKEAFDSKIPVEIYLNRVILEGQGEKEKE